MNNNNYNSCNLVNFPSSIGIDPVNSLLDKSLFRLIIKYIGNI